MNIWRAVVGDRALAAARRRQPYLNGALWTDLDRRTRLLVTVGRPGLAARRLAHAFRMWTMRPGDVFEDVCRNVVAVVTEVKPDHVEVVEITLNLLHAPRLDLSAGERVMIQPTRYVRKPDGHGWVRDHWKVADRERAGRARALLRAVPRGNWLEPVVR